MIIEAITVVNVAMTVAAVATHLRYAHIRHMGHTYTHKKRIFDNFECSSVLASHYRELDGFFFHTFCVNTPTDE